MSPVQAEWQDGDVDWSMLEGFIHSILQQPPEDRAAAIKAAKTILDAHVVADAADGTEKQGQVVTAYIRDSRGAAR